jgi:hypothetical protein
MHIQDGTLRAKLDGELTQAESLAAADHLAGCARCRRRAEEIAAQARRAGQLLATLTEPHPAASDAAAAWTRLETRFEKTRGHSGRASRNLSFEPLRRRVPRVFSLARRPSAWAGLWTWRPAPAFGALAAVLILVLSLSPPARAVAQKFLGLLRMRSVVVVPMERDFIAEGKGGLIGQLLSESVTVTKKENDQPAANRQEASRLAGFTVRLPSSRTDAPRLVVGGAHSFYFTANVQRLQTLAGILGRPDIPVPAGLDGARVVVDLARGVTAAYGNCPSRNGPPGRPSDFADCLMLAQAPAPTVATLPGLDLAEIAVAALELSGMTPEQARAFAGAVDWTSTLAIPLPRNAASSHNVTVDGAKGVLIEVGGMGHRPPGWALIWIKDGMVYSLAGFGSSSSALPAAGTIG